MRSCRNANFFGDAGFGESSNARGTGRVRCLAIESSMGRVMDLSAGGARIQRTGRLKVDHEAVFPLRIVSGIGSCELRARVRWERKEGLFSWMFGVEFVEVSPEARKVLLDIARAAPLDACLMHHSLNKSA